MAWIESHQSLGTHRKTLLAAEMLPMDKHKLIGHLHALWWWAIDNADIDGNLPEGTTPEIIAIGAEIPRKTAGNFVKTLVKVGFIDEIPGETPGYRLHDWYDYAGKLNAKREANRERMRLARAKNVPRTNPARAGATVPTKPTVPYIATTGRGNGTGEETGEPPDNAEQDPNLTVIAVCYERNIGVITPMVAEELKLVAEEYPPEWFQEAVKEAVKNNARNLKYVSSILARWKAEGYKSARKGGANGNGRQDTRGYAPPETREEASRRRTERLKSSVRKTG